jgi:integrase
MQREEYFNELEPQAIPYEEIIAATNNMTYGSIERVMFEALFLTGCRPSELDKFRTKGEDCFLKGNWLYWKPGKNQKGWRKEYLPNYYLKELSYYKATNRVYLDFFFAAKEISFRAYFNKKIRPYLSESWQTRRMTNVKWFKGYNLQLRGLRKSFITLIYANQLEKWKDPTIALDLTSKRLKHSTKNLTLNHYIKEFEHLNIDKWKESNPSEILALAGQRQLKNFEPNTKELNNQNSQLSLIDFS